MNKFYCVGDSMKQAVDGLEQEQPIWFDCSDGWQKFYNSGTEENKTFWSNDDVLLFQMQLIALAVTADRDSVASPWW